MLTGLRAMDTNRPSAQLNLVEWAKPSLSQKKKLKKIMDPRLQDAYPITGAMQIAEVILRCLESDPKNRPAMEEVLGTLQRVSAIKVKSKDTDQPSSAASSSSSHQNLRGQTHSRHTGAGAGSRVHLHPRTATARAC
ncbi:hypothetical protein SLEP1_g55154 [Rubroshorea leprosula]|uniref:Uncharacterized protein n=1 Tax=Rubroshorea leprosula TaxID=152421 RepID=A0AAV5MFM3_9ROSI|nr:hypothetical protein SLEP1_g55154 [Rubroshorea leprosula]